MGQIHVEECRVGFIGEHYRDIQRGLFREPIVGYKMGGLVNMPEAVLYVDVIDDATQLFGLLGGYRLSRASLLVSYAPDRLIRLS